MSSPGFPEATFINKRFKLFQKAEKMREIVSIFTYGDRLLVTFFAILLILYGLETYSFLQASGGEGLVGSASFPRVITVFGLMLVVIFFVTKGRVSKEKVDINQRVIAEFIDLVPLWLAIAYVACFEFLGYIIATFLYVTANMKYLGQKSWGGSAVYGLSLTVTLFTIFYYGLLGELPRGDLLNVHDILPFLDDIRRWIKG